MSDAALTVTGPVVTKDQIELIRRTVAAGATDDELRLHLYNCQRRGIHPLDGLLHFTKRGGKYTPVASIDLMRSRAAETGEYAGNDDPQFHGVPGDKDFAATATVWRFVQGQRCAFTATARWAEYYPGEQSGHMWRKMPHVMCGKVAEALALRKAFPQVLSGLYEKAEMDQADTPAPTTLVPPEPPQPTPEAPKRDRVVHRGKRDLILVTDDGPPPDDSPLPDVVPPPPAQPDKPPALLAEYDDSQDVNLPVRVVDIIDKSDISTKTGKPYQAWQIKFTDGRAATTFDSGVVNLAKKAMEADAIVIVEIEAKGKYLNITELRIV